MAIEEKYPYATRFLKQHPEMDLDSAIDFLQNKLMEGDSDGRRSENTFSK